MFKLVDKSIASESNKEVKTSSVNIIILEPKAFLTFCLSPALVKFESFMTRLIDALVRPSSSLFLSINPPSFVASSPTFTISASISAVSVLPFSDCIYVELSI